MTIAWSYLDKKTAAICALKDCDSMEYIIRGCAADVQAEYERALALGSRIPSDVPKPHNPRAGENRIVEALDQMDALKERYYCALEYMQWFKPAWNALSAEERLILSEFFLTDSSKTDAVGNISDKLFIERAQVYRRRDKAIEHLALLLYGK